MTLRLHTDPATTYCDSARAMAHENNMVWIYPRRKAGEKDAGTPAKGRPAMQLGYSAVAAFFDIPQGEAAQRPRRICFEFPTTSFSESEASLSQARLL